jgi:hypothetical protein
MQKSLALVIALLAPGISPIRAQTAPAASTPAKVAPAEAKKPALPAPRESAAPAPKKIEAKSTPLPPAATPQKVERIAVAPRPPKPESASGEAKPSFWKKIFGGKPTPAAATPAATPTPKPRLRKARPTPAPEDGAENEESPKPPRTKPAGEPAESAKPETPAVTKTPDVPKAEETKPAEPETPAVPAATPAPPKKTGKTRNTPEAKNIPPTTSADTEVQEKYNYDVAKAKALTDPEVLKLKEKAESAVNDDEARKAQRAYTKALFKKMRSIDESIKERADRIEAGILRRLESAE